MSTARSRVSSRAHVALLSAAAVAVSTRDASGLVRAVRAARRAGQPRRALAELGLMLRLYAGYPASIEFLRALDAVWPAPARTARPRAASNPERRGAALCRRVYGPDYARLRRFMRRLHPDLDRSMIVDGYGSTLARPGLALKDRELATVAALAALDFPQQLAAHEAGARRVGASPGQVALARRIGDRCRARARA